MDLEHESVDLVSQRSCERATPAQPDSLRGRLRLQSSNQIDRVVRDEVDVPSDLAGPVGPADDVLTQVRVGIVDALRGSDGEGVPSHDHRVVGVVGGFDPDRGQHVTGQGLGKLVHQSVDVIARLGERLERSIGASDVAVDADGDVIGERAHDDLHVRRM